MKLRVLLVEDNAVNRELAQDLLEVEGHVVSIAEDGPSYRAAILGPEPPPDIVLMDILLADTSGIALLHELRSHARFERVPVIAVTAQALSGDSERLLAEGFDGVITKPIDTRTFSSRIEHHASVGHEPPRRS